MNKLTPILMLAAAALCAEPLSLTVNLKGFKSDKCAVEVAIFDQAAAFPTKPEKAIAKQRAPITGATATVEFRDLKPTKDQFNYSRSYWFNFLPFYHMGFRASYPLTGWLNASYWLTNGLNQTEDFNGFKSQAVLLNFTPSPRLSANLNYFSGQEQRAVSGRAPRGRSHFVDGYVTWQASDRWQLAGEADYAIERIDPTSAPSVIFGGAAYARYRLSRKVHLAGRFVYLNDRNGWFSGTSQALKDATATATFDLVDGFQMRWEVRRDWSGSPWFATDDSTRRKRDQTTALLGLIWWFGGKQGSW